MLLLRRSTPAWRQDGRRKRPEGQNPAIFSPKPVKLALLLGSQDGTDARLCVANDGDQSRLRLATNLLHFVPGFDEYLVESPALHGIQS